MAHVSIIGTGNTGSAVGAVVSGGGHTLELLGQGDAARPISGEVVMPAVSYGAVAGILAQRGEQLADRVVVDISNPVDFGTLDHLLVPADGSAAAQTAARLPRRAAHARADGR